ncbi:MAG: radical SAM/SPASM domain-containing protein [Methanogenium sp.]|jgi:hypothetical protein
MKAYQIETSAFCNAECSYCPHQKMTRVQGNMSIETFDQVLSVMENKYVALHHFGEPFLNPNLSLFIHKTNEKGIQVEFSTNGSIDSIGRIKNVMSESPYRVRIAYDYFNPFSFIYHCILLNKNTIITVHSVKDLSKLLTKKPFTNYAGAVEGKSEIEGECYFKKYGYVCVLWDGRVVPCCCDYDGKEIIGDVFHPETIKLKETYDLCKNCTGMQFAEGGKWDF